MPDVDSPSTRRLSGGSIPSLIRQHSDDLFSVRIEEINRLQADGERSLHATYIRQHLNPACIPAGLVQVFTRKMERVREARIDSWMEAYSSAGKIPRESELNEIASEISGIVEVVCASGIDQMERLEKTSGGYGGSLAAASALTRAKGAVVCVVPRDLRLAVRALEARLKETPKPAPPEGAAASEEIAASQEVAPIENCFREEGQLWRVRFGGKELSFPNSLGMRYIRELLKNPGRELHALELRSGEGQPSGRTDEFISELSVRAPQDAGEVSDPTARAQYRKRLQEIRREREDAVDEKDDKKIEQLDEEAEQIGKELKRSTGLAGRPRHLDDPKDKARKAVQMAIARSMDEIRKRIPELGTHLDRFVHTGVQCSYRPDVPVHWEL